MPPAPTSWSAEEDGLVRAILADPHDGLARSAYADWLEERGKPLHAELYRLRCEDFERAKQLTGQLDKAISAAYPDCRATRLYLGRGARGVARMGMLPPSAFISKKFQACAGEILREFHVIGVSLVGTTKDWSKVGDAPAMAGLRALDLNSASGGPEAIARCDNVGGLFSLYAGHLQGRDLPAFAGSEKLRRLIHLDLHGLKGAADALPALASGPLAGRLQNLAVGQARLHGPGFAALLRAGALLEGLTALSLNNNDLDAAEVEALGASPHLAGLRSLNLSWNALNDAGVKALARSPLAGRLRWLDFSHGGEVTEVHRTLAAALHSDCRVRFFVVKPAEVRKMRDFYGGRWGED